MNILITGGAGFVGSNVGAYLKTKYPHYEIIALDNLRRRGSETNLNILRNHSIKFVHGDIRNKEDLEINEDIDCIIDASADPSVLAGINSPVSPLINTNLMGTANALELASKHKALFVFLSTSRVYPIHNIEQANFVELKTRFQWTDEQSQSGISQKGINEEFSLNGSRSFYGYTKLASELLIEEYIANKNLKAIIDRCGVISGPGQMGKADQGIAVFWLASHYFKNKLKYIGYGGKGKQLRDILHIDDLCALIADQIHNYDKYKKQIFNVGGGLPNSLSLLEMTDICQKITGNKIDTVAEKENRSADIRIYVTDNTKVNKVNHWYPKKSNDQLFYEIYIWIKENEQRLKSIISL